MNIHSFFFILFLKKKKLKKKRKKRKHEVDFVFYFIDSWVFYS